MFVRDANRNSRDWKDAVSFYAAQQTAGRSLLEGPLAVVMTFYRPRPKGHYGRRGTILPSAPSFPTTKPDALKLARAVEDAMTGIVYRDDAQIVEEQIRKLYGEPARVEVSVSEIV